MNPWLQDPISNPNNHAGFGPMADGSMSYLQPPQTINPSQFQNPSYLNGAGRTASPAYANPMYQTNQVIPSKRSREDSLGTSPRQAPGGLPGSRSQTPGQGPYVGYNPQTNGASGMSNAPTPFQHLQTSANATPSPTTQHMNFGQAAGPQRVSTASPSPFSPQHGPPHPSPAPVDQANRVGTPHDNPQQFMPNQSFGPGFNPAAFNQNMSNGMGQMGMNPQMNMAQPHPGMTAAQRNYQMQIQAQARQMQPQAQPRNVNGMSNSPNQSMPNVPTGQMQPGSLNIPRPNNPEDFLKGLQAFMAARGRTVDLNPVICGRPLQLLRLYLAVIKAGGSQKITKLNQWGLLAQQFGFPPQQVQAAHELQSYWMTNLAPYESAWQMSQKQRMASQAAAMQSQAPNRMSPPRDSQQNQDPSSAGHQRTQSEMSNMKMAQPAPSQPQHPIMNGFAQPIPPQVQQDQPISTQHHPNLSRQFENQPVTAVHNQMPGPSPQKRPQTGVEKVLEQEKLPVMPFKKPIEDPFEPDTLPPSRLHGPINVEEISVLGQHVVDAKPHIPTIREIGIIDIHALTMAIKSGMHAETRVALDTLVTLSTELSLQLALAECDDLMDTLINCAQEQVDFLAEHATEVSDEMILPSYEELVRACRVEAEGIQNIPEFGTVNYDLGMAADRLICITTLIRNFSFYEANFVVLGQPEVLKLLSNIIRHIGTKQMLLRTQRNTLDFMKDVIIYLSILSTSLTLPGKEEALCLLHLLLAFAPIPQPLCATSDKVIFTMYSPHLHKYMPSAVDSLAKLLARDEPNRTYFKSIFSADAHSTPPYELLTRTFGLAIAPVPATSNQTKAMVKARMPFLLQGMLAAEILAGLAPGSDHQIARSWLESEDGFASSLLRLINLLSADRAVQPQRQPHQQPNRNPAEQDADANNTITIRAMAVLKILVQKARIVDEDGTVILPIGVIPKKESLLGAMIQKDIDRGILRQLCVYAGLED